MGMNLPERIFLQAFQGQVTVVLVPLQDPLPFLKPGHPLADYLKQVVELFDGGRRGVAEAVLAGIALHEHTIQKQHVKVDVEIQGGAEALDQGHCAGVSLLFGAASSVGQLGGDSPGRGPAPGSSAPGRRRTGSAGGMGPSAPTGG